MDHTETWKTVPFAPEYEASDFGRVRRARGRIAGLHGHVMTQTTYGAGYKSVTMFYDGRQRKHGVHRVVCAAFHGLPLAGQEASHIDGTKDNNRPDNLAWRTHAENCADKVGHGTRQSGSRNPAAKLSLDAVSTIRSAKSEWGYRRRLAAQFGVSVSLISQIRAGDVWELFPDAEIMGITQ